MEVQPEMPAMKSVLIVPLAVRLRGTNTLLPKMLCDGCIFNEFDKSDHIFSMRMITDFRFDIQDISLWMC